MASMSIDNPDQVERLMAKLTETLPLSAIVTPHLAAALQQRAPEDAVPRRCSVISISYTGDEGGIVCRLEFGPSYEGDAVFTSITHLGFDARLAVARDIAVYQKRRTKRLRVQAR